MKLCSDHLINLVWCAGGEIDTSVKDGAFWLLACCSNKSVIRMLMPEKQVREQRETTCELVMSLSVLCLSQHMNAGFKTTLLSAPSLDIHLLVHAHPRSTWTVQNPPSAVEKT